MKRNCDTCKEEYEYYRKTSRFCSDKCRMAFGRNNPKPDKDISKVEMRVLYNTMLEMIGKINITPAPAFYDRPSLAKHNKDEPKQWVEPESEKSFQQYMNEISELQYEDEFKKKAVEIEAATNLSKKQKDLLIINMRQSKL